MVNLFSIAAPAVREGATRYVFPEGKFIKTTAEQAFELATLLLNLAQESVSALKERRFSTFDALLMSQGCQITACQVYFAVMKPELFDEADRVEALLSKAQSELKSLKGKKGDLNTFKANADVNFPLSAEMQQMIRFYMLRKVRVIIPFGSGFRHTTDFKQLKSVSNLGLKALDSLVRSLQREESELAAAYILERARKITPQSRQAVLVEAVAEKKLNDSNVFQLSVFYTLEVCLRDFSGVMKIVDLEKEGSVVISFPEANRLNPGELSDLKAPLMVVEAYFREGGLDALNESIRTNRVFEFLMTAAAQEVRRTPTLGKYTEDMKTLLSLPETDSFPFQLKHFYTASVKEAL